MTRLLGLIPGVALAACAHAPSSPPPEAAEPGFELPVELRRDPATVPVGELRFEPPEPQIERLTNGLTVYLLEDRTVPLVQVRALVDLGNLDDPDDEAGLAQATWAALRTGGAGRLLPSALDERLEDLAATLDGEVGDELAELALEVRTADLSEGLSLFSDLLRRPRFDEKAFARVLEQAADEVERRHDDAAEVARVAFLNALWGEGSPFAREPSHASLARIHREDAVRLHDGFVVPGSVRLIVTGDFDSGKLKDALQALLGDWSHAPRPPRKLPAPAQPAGRQVLVVPTSGAQAKIRLGHLGIARHDPRELAVGLLDAVVGSPLVPSRLYADIRDKRGLAYSVESAMAPGPIRGTVVLAADTAPEKAREVIARCIEQIEAVRGERPPAEAEIALAREAAVNAYAFRFESAAQAARARALRDAQGYPADYFRTFRDRLRSVRAAEVVAAARETLHPEALHIVVVGDPRRMGDLSEFGPVRTVLETP